jgi:hypothetical protein
VTSRKPTFYQYLYIHTDFSSREDAIVEQAREDAQVMHDAAKEDAHAK